jgi:hypothetical protein
MKPLQILYLTLLAMIGVNAFYIPDISSLVRRKGGGHGGSGHGGGKGGGRGGGGKGGGNFTFSSSKSGGN